MTTTLSIIASLTGKWQTTQVATRQLEPERAKEGKVESIGFLGGELGGKAERTFTLRAGGGDLNRAFAWRRGGGRRRGGALGLLLRLVGGEEGGRRGEAGEGGERLSTGNCCRGWEKLTRWAIQKGRVENRSSSSSSFDFVQTRHLMIALVFCFVFSSFSSCFFFFSCIIHIS